jgi:hypothetical protein
VRVTVATKRGKTDETVVVEMGKKCGRNNGRKNGQRKGRKTARE